MAAAVKVYNDQLQKDVVTGKITCANPAVAIYVELGFVPTKVEILNQTQLARGEWNKNLTDAYYFKTVTDGTLSLVTSAGITPYAGDMTYKPGFIIGTDAVLNTASDVLYFTAYR